MTGQQWKSDRAFAWCASVGILCMSAIYAALLGVVAHWLYQYVMVSGGFFMIRLLSKAP